MPVETGTTTGTSAGAGGSMGSGGQGGYVGAPGTNRGAWSGNGPSIGLTTGTTWHGNTAFGPSGGMATGYSTRDAQSLGQAGMAPTMGTYSNFNTMSGQPMFGGALGGQGFNGMNANQAYGTANSYYQQLRDYMQSRRPSDVQTAPLPPMQRPATMPPAPAVPLNKAQMPAFFAQQQPAPAVNNFGPRTYDGGYTYSTTKNSSMLNNPQYGYTGGSLANYAGGTAGNKTNLR